MLKKLCYRTMLIIAVVLFLSYGPYSTEGVKAAEGTNTIKNIDFNYDWTVNVMDLSLAAKHYNVSGSTALGYDLNSDGVVDIYDLTRISKQFGAAISLDSTSISRAVEQWEPFKAPEAVEVCYSTGLRVPISVTWASTGLNTSTSGTKTASGNMQGYNRALTLSLTVTPIQETGVHSGNIINSGMVAQQGSWVYYLNFANSGALSKVRIDGTGVAKISDDLPFYINVVNNWIYYSNLSDDGAIYKIKNDGTGRVKLNSDVSDFTTVVGDWIYYLNSIDEYNVKLYKMKIDGTQRTMVSSDTAAYINVVGDWIYYCNYSENGEIYKIKTDGTVRTKINADGAAYINVVGDWIYYQNLNDPDMSTYKIRIDGTGKARLNSLVSEGLNVKGDYIYYLNSDYVNPTVMRKMKVDGTGDAAIPTSYSPSSINIGGDWLYYLNFEGEYPLYRINLNGTNESQFGIDTVIGHIKNMERNTTQGDIYEFPKEVIGVMSDGSLQYLPVTWNSYQMDTSKLGSASFQGRVDGYDGYANLKVTVVERGNTNGNFINKGIVAHKNGWIYYINNADKKLYKIMDNGTGRMKLTDDMPSNINVIGDWVYYVNNDYSTGGIYKIKTDGTLKTKLSDDLPQNMVAAGEWIYFENQRDRYTIYKMKTDGTERYMLNDAFGSELNIAGDWIYYTSYGGGESGIWRVSSDGMTVEEVVDAAARSINVAGNYMYYIDNSNGGAIYRAKLDGTEITKLGDNRTEVLNVDGDWIYYSNLSDGSSLYKMRLDGTMKTKLSSDVIYSAPSGACRINTEGDWVYYYNYSDNGRIYRIKKDGTGRELALVDTTITRVDNISATITVGTPYTPPSIVTSYYGDGYTKQVSIVWNPSTVDTSRAGTFTYEGTVQGYTPKVILTVNVVQSEIRGNTLGNMQNTSYTAESKGWIYYVNAADGSKLYKIMPDGTGKVRLNSGYTFSVNVVEDWVYYYTYDGLYKMKTDGTGNVKIGSAMGNYLVVNDGVYYVNEADSNRIYRVKTDGSGNVKVTEDGVRSFYVYEGWLYYKNDMDSGRIYKVRVDGTGRTKLSDDFTGQFDVQNGVIYYTEGYSNLYRMYLDGTGKTLISSTCLNDFNVYGDSIYYRDSYKLYKMKADGTGKVLLYDKDITQINVSGSWVYFRTNWDNNYYRMKLDGSSLQLVN